MDLIVSKKLFGLGVTMLAMVAMAGCSTTTGTLGSVTAFTPTEAVSGPYSNLETGILSGRIAEGLNSNIRKLALETEYLALERGQSGAAVKWEAPSGESGEVIPQQPYQVGDRDCRRYTHRIVAGSGENSATGTACRAADGSWTPLS